MKKDKKKEEEAKEKARKIYETFWPEHTSHQEWANGFNIRGDIKLIIEGKEPLG